MSRRKCLHTFKEESVEDDRKSLPNSRTPADGRQQFRLEDILGLITLLLGVPFGMIFVASELVASTVFRMASLGIHWMSYKRKSRVMPGDGHVLITGASSGIGMDVAKQLALRGYNLVLVARRKELLEELANELRMHKRAGTEVFLDVQIGDCSQPVYVYVFKGHDPYPKRRGSHVNRVQRQVLPVYEVIPTDLALPGAAAELVKETQSRSLDISILVNNAGFSRAGDFLDVPFATLADVLVVNSQVCMELMRLYLPFMVARDRGHVMNVASVAAAIPGPGMAVYHATKSFLSSLGRGVNAELRGTGVSVTTVWPGSTATGLFEACNAPRAIIGCLPVMVQTSQDAASQAVRGTLAHESFVILGTTLLCNWLLVHMRPLMPDAYACWLMRFFWKDMP